MKHFCQCGAQLKARKTSKSGVKKIISYKALIVQTTTLYYCPNGCELKNVTSQK